MIVTFDAAKRDRTLLQRGLDFSRATEVFETAVFQYDDGRSDYGEARRVTFDYLDGRLVAVVWTDRPDSRRIISLRKANAREQRRYDTGAAGS